MNGTETQQTIISGKSRAGERAKQIAYLLGPPLVCLIVWWPGLLSWFQRDDFAWLGLHHDTATWPAFWHTMFAPKAQGTIRPLSERAFFLGFWRLFHANALPYHVLAFVTQFLNLALLASVMRRISGSRAVGLLSAVLWAVNSALASALCWTAAYNEVLFATFLLLSLRFRMLFMDTSRRRFYAAEWISFLLGFGALEINVVYPAIATGYVLACPAQERSNAGQAIRRHGLLRHLAPFWLVSVAYSALHAWVAPPGRTGVYALHVDPGMAVTATTYWKMALAPRWFEALHVPRLALVCGIAIFTVALLGFAALKARHHNWMPVFLLAWFWVVLAPVLPLRDHVMKYYLTVPLAGLSALGAWAAAWAWKRFPALRVAVLVAVVFYVMTQAAGARTLALWHYTQSRLAHALVRNVIEARRANPGKAVLLADVDDELYLAALADRAFRALAVPDVYLAPPVDVQGWATVRIQTSTVTELTRPRARVLTDLLGHRAIVIAARTAGARPVNDLYLKAALRQWNDEPNRVALGDDRFQPQLGDGWYAAEQGFRWMKQRATLTLAAPRTAGQKLYLRGSAPPFTGRPMLMTVTVSGVPIGRHNFKGGERFEAAFDLPAALTGSGAMEIAIEMDRTVTLPPDQRELGLALATIEIR